MIDIALSLPAAQEQSLPFAPSLPEVARHTAPRFQLKRGPLVDRPDIWSLDISRGCAFRLAHDASRAAGDYPGERVVSIADGAAEQLERELAVRRQKPRV